MKPYANLSFFTLLTPHVPATGIEPARTSTSCWRLCQFAYTGSVVLADPQFTCLWVCTYGLADLLPDRPETVGAQVQTNAVVDALVLVEGDPQLVRELVFVVRLVVKVPAALVTVDGLDPHGDVLRTRHLPLLVLDFFGHAPRGGFEP